MLRKKKYKKKIVSMNKFYIRILCKKKKNCLNESNETIEGTNFAFEYYAKKKKKKINKSNEIFEGTNFILKCYAKKKSFRRIE